MESEWKEVLMTEAEAGVTCFEYDHKPKNAVDLEELEELRKS